MSDFGELSLLLDGALSAARSHQAARACELMRELVWRASLLPLESTGPERLTAAFYLNSALAFLNVHRAPVVA